MPNFFVYKMAIKNNIELTRLWIYNKIIHVVVVGGGDRWWSFAWSTIIEAELTVK